jgi:hypothetical protein
VLNIGRTPVIVVEAVSKTHAHVSFGWIPSAPPDTPATSASVVLLTR